MGIYYWYPNSNKSKKENYLVKKPELIISQKLKIRQRDIKKDKKDKQTQKLKDRKLVINIVD